LASGPNRLDFDLRDSPAILCALQSASPNAGSFENRPVLFVAEERDYVGANGGIVPVVIDDDA